MAHRWRSFSKFYLNLDLNQVERFLCDHLFTGIVDYVREKTDPEWKPPASPVIVLTSENFTKTVRDVDLMLVEFYAPWCKHCQQVRPVDVINIFSVQGHCHSHGTSDVFHSWNSFNF